MSRETYPLGHSAGEIERLDLQAKLLHDPLLDQLAAQATRCLELGVGAGSNIPLLKAASPGLSFHGIDDSELAVQRARAMHGGSGVELEVMSATDLRYPNACFDLVVAKLVLWAIGPVWPKALREALRVLRPGGVCYAFEPYDHGLVFAPARPTLQAAIRDWDRTAVLRGADPFIGPKLPQAFHEAGFSEVRAKPFQVFALAEEREKYFAICENLRKFYFGDSPGTPELFQDDPGSLVMDQFFVTWGIKPGEG